VDRVRVRRWTWRASPAWLGRPDRWRLRLLWAVLAAVTAAVAVSAFVIQQELRTVWAAVIVALAAAAALFASPLIDALRHQHSAQRMLLVGRCLVNARTGWLPRIGGLRDPLALGVHPAVDVPANNQPPARLSNRVPPYVPRDVDDELDAALVRGGFVLLVGDSTAGKSRAAYEAMRRRLPDRWLLIPSVRDRDGRPALRALLDAGLSTRDLVIWLDDLERYLGVDGLDLELLGRLLGDGGRRVVVLATMRLPEYAAQGGAPHPDRTSTDQIMGRAGEKLLDLVDVRIDLPRMATRNERERAQQQAQKDPRIADALAHADRYGLAEYLAAGPKLLTEWEHAWEISDDPVLMAGAALVAAAVDCRRTGWNEPVPASLLKELATGYLDEIQLGRLIPEALERGLAWAAHPRYGASALLTRRVDDRYLAFDYLVDTRERDAGAPTVPEQVWKRVIETADPRQVTQIAFRAELTGQWELGLLGFYRAATIGDAFAMGRVADLAHGRGNWEEAATWYQRVVDAGKTWPMGRLGWLAEQRGDPDEAAAWYRKALDAGDSWTAINLARRAEERDDLDEAVTWYREAIAVAQRATSHRNPDEAVARNREVGDVGFAHAVHSLARLAEEGGDQDQAIIWYRKAIDSTDPWAQLQIKMAADAGSSAAVLALSQAADAGNDWAIHELGRVLEKRRNLEAAATCYREAADRGNAFAMAALGRLAEERGDLDEAVTWYRKADASGLWVRSAMFWSLEVRRSTGRWWRGLWKRHRR